MSYVLTDFTRPGNKPPGMSEKIKMCLQSEAIIPAKAVDEFFLLAGDITFTTTEHGWVDVYATKDTVKAMLSRVGMKDSRQLNAQLEFFIPGLDDKWMRALIEDPQALFLVKPPVCAGTEWWLFGDDCRGMEILGDFDSALASDESGRHGITAGAQGYLPQYYRYNGDIIIPGWE